MGILFLKKQKGSKTVMIEQDTVRLLRECDAGIKMGTSAIDEVLDYVRSEELKKYLADCKRKHDELNTDIHILNEKSG